MLPLGDFYHCWIKSVGRGSRNTDVAEGQHGTNPLHPDTDQDGWPDGAELAEKLLPFLYSYQLNASRDFFTVPRSQVLPDALVTMNWYHDQTSTMDVTGYMIECYQDPQPDDVKTDGTEYRWPGSGDGTSQYWKITFGNPTKQYSPPEESDRLPSQQIDIPWERCAGLYRTNVTTNMSFYGSLNRSASAIVHLKSDAPTWPKPKRSAVLSCSTWNMSDDPELASGATGSKITRGRSEQDRFQNYEPHKPVLWGW